MNDNVIISTISKIHFIIISALSFIFLILFTTFILLQNGIFIEEISLQKVKVKQLYIKWDEKISLGAKELIIFDRKNKNDTRIDYKKTIRNIKNSLVFANWFKRITVENISYNDIKADLEYIDDEKGFFHISSPEFYLNSSLYKKTDSLYISIDKLDMFDKNIAVMGRAIFEMKKDLELSASLNIDINKSTQLVLHVKSDTKKLSYRIESADDINNPKNIVKLFNINPKIRYWVDDAIEVSSLSLKKFYGWFEYKNIDKAYMHLYANAQASYLKYTYDKKLAPIRSQSTSLEFKKGVLYIKPQNAYSYDFFLDKSNLKIDFSKKEELLTLYLLFKGRVNDDILTLLNRYKIKLPFIQTKGDVDTNLKLAINLHSLSVDAIGDFYVKDSKIKYLGLDIDITNAHVFLKNTDVRADKIAAKYKDIAAANVNLTYNAKRSEGKLSFVFDDITLKEHDLRLVKRKKKLNAVYIISPKEDFLDIQHSVWKYKEQTVDIESMKVPFDITTLKAKIPSTSVTIKDKLSALVSAKIDFNSSKADINIDMLGLNHEGIKLIKPYPSFKLEYIDGELSTNKKEPVALMVDDKKLILENISLSLSSASVKADNLHINYSDFVKSNISADYNLKSQTAIVDIHNIEFKQNNIDEYFKNDKNIELLIQNKADMTSISSKEYDFEYLFNKDGWNLNLNSLKKIYPYSDILKKYSLTNGYLRVQKNKDNNNIVFSLNTDYKYKFLATHTEPIKSYLINGAFNYENGYANFKINDSIEVNIKDNINIKADNTGININELLNFFAQRNNTSDEKYNKDIHFNASNSYIFLGKNRRVISKSIDLKYVHDILSAKLIYKDGRAFFELNNGKLYLYGTDFNDEFMDKLFANSKFKGGSLDFYISGTTKEYGGIIYAKDTTILDYKVLNNILAFVNTVPSLVTFSLPGYNKNGIAAKNAYMNFKFKDGIYDISDIYLKSKEIDIAGYGKASIEQNSIDLDLNLKTDLGSSVSKIPLIGHILLGKETVSTTLKVTGALDDPDVTTQLAKDIVVAPFNILKRTLMYPFELFKKDDKHSE